LGSIKHFKRRLQSNGKVKTLLNSYEKIRWGDFKIQDLFSKIKIKKPKYKASELPDKPDDLFNLPALTAGIKNQGLNNFIPKNEVEVLNNVISISANGANTGATFYQKRDFTVLQDAYAIKWSFDKKELSENQSLFLTNVISKRIFGNYEWTNKAGWERIKNENIKLPLNDGSIDFDFMDDFISCIKNSYQCKINDYISKEYKLNDTDFELSSFYDCVFKEFKIDDLFNISRGNISNQKQLIDDFSGINFVTQNDNDNGFVKKVIPEKNKIFSGKSIIVGRQTGLVYYQNKDFITTDGVLVLLPKDSFVLNKFIGLTIASYLKMYTKSFGYTNPASAEKLRNIKLNLPIKNGNIDFNILEKISQTIVLNKIEKIKNDF